ncbi:MAG: TPM domain-containing protein [Cellvibrionaceae bacterium]
MTLLNQAELEQVSKKIESVEKETDAELITVLSQRAENYYYIPTLWAAILALLTPLILRLTPFWLDENEMLLAQWLTFIVAAILFRIPFIMMKLVPKRVKFWAAANLARRQFLENNLHHTKDSTGLLIFVSEAEHYVEIIADKGISDLVDNRQWQAIINTFIAEVKKGNTQKGFLQCIESCGELLKLHAPATQEKNELPNHLVVLS